MSQCSSYTLRAARREDNKAIRMLLASATEAFNDILVAESTSEGFVVAAAGLTRSERPKPLVGPGITLHVIPPYRLRGIARAMLEQLTSRAKQRRAEALYATQKVDHDGEQMQAWTALGFAPCETVIHHELSLDQFEPQLAPLYERMRQRGKIPPSAQIIPLYDADLAEIVRLHRATLGGDPTLLGQKLRGEVPGAFAPRHSRVLLIDGRVVGFILGHRVSDDVVHVDANVVAPEVRGSWANVWLKLKATRGALQWGIKKFVFTSFDHYQDTRSFTDRLGGLAVKKLVLMYHPLEPFRGDGVGCEQPLSLD